jgi:hypothetical protein
MQRYIVYFIWKLLYMFRVYHHPSSGAQTTVYTASGICHTVTATCRYRGRVGTGLSVLWVEYVTLNLVGYVLEYDRPIPSEIHSKFTQQKN